MENLQKITRRQIETITSQASRDLAGKLLPILDALRQAGSFAHGDKPLPSEEIAIGLDMLYNQLMDILGTVGLEEIKAVGQVLDPAKHEVVSYDELSTSEENSVVEEVRKGYILNGKVIRPSMVIVAKHKVAERESTDEAP
jgi:molecular chaperone GrpE